jgi:hypothetical protein
MLHYALDRTVLAAGVAALEYDQHLVTVFDHVLLNLNQLNLEAAKRRLVASPRVRNPLGSF